MDILESFAEFPYDYVYFKARVSVMNAIANWDDNFHTITSILKLPGMGLPQ